MGELLISVCLSITPLPRDSGDGVSEPLLTPSLWNLQPVLEQKTGVSLPDPH